MEANSTESIACRFHVDRDPALNLGFLSPTITRTILQGEQPQTQPSQVGRGGGFTTRDGDHGLKTGKIPYPVRLCLAPENDVFARIARNSYRSRRDCDVANSTAEDGSKTCSAPPDSNRSRMRRCAGDAKWSAEPPLASDAACLDHTQCGERTTEWLLGHPHEPPGDKPTG